MKTIWYILIGVFGSILLIILLTLLLFLIWVRKRRKELVRNGTLIDTALGQVEYWMEGTGPTIVMCHGGPGGYDQGYMLSSLIAEGFQVLCFSRPGYLRTPLLQDNTIEAQADLLSALLEKLDIPKVVLAGFSAGGPIALAFAQNYPEKTNGLMLEAAVSREYIPADDVEGSMFAKIFMNPKIQDFMYFIMMVILIKIIPYALVNTILKVETTLSKNERKVFISYLKSHPKDFEWFKNFMENTAPLSDRDAGLQNDLKLFKNITEMPVNKILCPTIIMHSPHDNDVKWEHAEYLINSISQAELFKPFGGHLMWFGPDADAIRKKRVDFLNKFK